MIKSFQCVHIFYFIITTIATPASNVAVEKYVIIRYCVYTINTVTAHCWARSVFYEEVGMGKNLPSPSRISNDVRLSAALPPNFI